MPKVISLAVLGLAIAGCVFLEEERSGQHSLAQEAIPFDWQTDPWDIETYNRTSDFKNTRKLSKKEDPGFMRPGFGKEVYYAERVADSHPLYYQSIFSRSSTRI